MKTGIELIAEERQRQIEIEGWTSEHDATTNENEQLALAALCYAMPHLNRGDFGWNTPELWPWSFSWWKPSPNDRVKELTKAGALIAAEIDRLQRL